MSAENVSPIRRNDQSMSSETFTTHDKALRINLDPSKYGTCVEIGAGQEVARWFFRVGGASGTIAKTMSAYDMTISDAIYGPCDRYVSQQRLQSMLQREFLLLQERLNEKRGATTRFFVFANTVAARSYTRKDDAHGWLGVEFQTEPNGPSSQIIIHARLLDKENLQEQEALGVGGVNLIYGAIYQYKDPYALIDALLDNLTTDRLEVDMIEFSGPAFAGVDNRLMSLQLVQKGLTKAAMFFSKGTVVQPADVLHKKCIIVVRGSFRPVTKVTIDMLECATAQFVQEPKVQCEDVVVLMEMTLKNLIDGDTIDDKDFLDRVDILGSLGKTVLISNFAEFHRLASYPFLYTNKRVGIVMGVPTLEEIFDQHYYSYSGGGSHGRCGLLFKNDLKLYVYPFREPKSGSIISAGNLRVAPNLRHLYAYLLENRL